MTLLAQWMYPGTMRLLALALLHFLWQGAALAAMAYLAIALCRSASVRYALGVGTLALMFAAPVITFLVLRAQEQVGPTAVSAETANAALSINSSSVLTSTNPIPGGSDSAPVYLLWLVEVWMAGVVLLSLRSAGGFLLVERLRRLETVPVTEELLELCLSLQRRMGMSRVVRYCESLHLDAPAVAGWIRPVVLLPVSALTGLTAVQLEAVIAHELAHIRRFDAFVNLFQVAVETLLFYHPGVWWLGKRIRAEREHCCDDAAVVLCGNPVTYAQALAHLAEAKAAPDLVMAANRSPLVERIARLLGAKTASESFRGATLTASALCLSVALLAGSAFVGSTHSVHAQTPAPALAPAASSAATSIYHSHLPQMPDLSVTVQPAAPVPDPILAPTLVPLAALVVPPTPSPVPEPSQESTGSKQSYIDSMKEAGLTNLTVDELIELKVQGITPEYVKSMKELGVKVDVDELVGMKVQGITPDYVKEMRATTGQNLSGDELIGLKVQGITPDYVKQVHELGMKADADDLIGLKVQGVTPEYVREMRSLGLKVDSDEVIGIKVQGITPEYVKSMQELGLRPNSDELIGMKVQGITPAYVKELQAAGYKVDAEEAISAKVQGITPEFIAKVRSHGFKDLTLDKLIALKVTGALDAEK